MTRDIVAGLLLILALAFPWTTSVGVGIQGTPGWVTLLSLASLVIGHVGRRGGLAPLRLVLTIPYLLAFVLFVGSDLVQSIRHGGTGSTPPGVGPGAWLGLAGAVLAAQSASTSGRGVPDFGRVWWFRLIGFASIAAASAAAAFNLYWRVRFVIPNVTDPDTSRQNLVTVVTAILYGIVALAPVALVAWWLIAASPRTRIAILFLGSSTLLSGTLVWLLPVGRDLDAFHGIAQSTSMAGVGFEGYLAWVAAAAIIGGSLMSGRGAAEFSKSWLPTARNCLVLIALWCTGTAILRVLDIASAAVLDLPTPAYNSTVMMVFDLAVALLAGWILINGLRDAVPGAISVVLLGVLFATTVIRIVIGVALVPRSKPLDPGDINPMYGNDLYQQITSTFDVTLSLLALLVFVAAAALFWRRDTRTSEASAPSIHRTDKPADVSGTSQQRGFVGRLSGSALALGVAVAACGGSGIAGAAPEDSDGAGGSAPSRSQPGPAQSQAGPAPQSGVPFVGPHPGQLNAHAEEQVLGPDDVSAQSRSTPDDQQCSPEQTCPVSCSLASPAQVRAAVVEPETCG